MQFAAVNDYIPSESEIDMAVRVFKGGRVGDPSGMRAEDLKGWCQEAKREKDPEGRRWYIVVRLVQVMFRDGTVPEEIAWAIMVLIPKLKGGCRFIRLVELLLKL